MDDDMQAIEVRDREIERRLEAFARARLSPDREIVARTRARIMREARLQFEASRIAAHMAPALVVAPRRPIARRLAMPILAASVWLAIAAGSIAAATAGGPLYPARLWVENAVLPADGTSRASAEISRLNDRLGEVVAGAARGDAAAVEAALDAYRQIADEAIAASRGDATLEALVAAALDNHRAILSAVEIALADKGSDTAAAALEASIERAIHHNQSVVDDVHASGTGAGDGLSAPTRDPGTGAGTGAGTGSGTGTSTGTGSGSGSGSGSGAGAGSGDTGGGGSGSGSGESKPARTPKPTPAPPAPPASPDPQGQPEHTPRADNE
jgi:uncharacterized membrane protein YgcG